MELYKILAQWTGWPVIVATLLIGGGYAYVILNKQIDIITQEKDFLEKQLQEAKLFSPDLVLQRLMERHKILSEEIEQLTAEKSLDKEKINGLSEEKSKIAHEMSRKILTYLQSILAQAENYILLDSANTSPETEIVVNKIIDNIIEAGNRLRID